MITRRIKAKGNLRLATRMESVQLVKDQVIDVNFESNKELDSFLSLDLFEVADGKLVGLPIAPVVAPPVVAPVVEAPVAVDPITPAEEDVPDVEVGDVTAETEAEVDVPAETEPIEDAINPVADPDTLPDGPAPTETVPTPKDVKPEGRNSGRGRRRLNLKAK